MEFHQQDNPTDQIQCNDSNPTKLAAAQGKLTKELILKEYSDCFDKMGRSSGEKYHIKLIDNLVPVVYALRTVPVHILPLYKAELDKMIAEGIIVSVTEPIDWVNLIVCHVTYKPDGAKKGETLSGSKRFEQKYSNRILL